MCRGQPRAAGAAGTAGAGDGAAGAAGAAGADRPRGALVHSAAYQEEE